MHLVPTSCPVNLTSPFRADDEYTQKSRSSFIRSFSSDIRMDLKQQLQCSVREVIHHYASFVSNVCSSLINTGLTAEVLSSFLLSLPAFKNERMKERGLVLLSGVRDQLEKAESIYDVINTLSVDHASFVNCDIYKNIVGEFGCERDHDRLSRYLELLHDYIDRHKLLEYIELNPTFGRVADASDKIIVRLDVDLTMRISQLLDHRIKLAAVLGLWGTTLRLFDLEEGGTVIITFLIPGILAREVFADLTLTPQQVGEFRALSVVWLKYRDTTLNFAMESADGGVVVVKDPTAMEDVVDEENLEENITIETGPDEDMFVEA